ncbi:hypothetical protein M1583_00100 [Candidatus Marsarchaeota archaeon]|nr:hypothetical protein [Candidatus Marsarchaeota archaeon]
MKNNAHGYIAIPVLILLSFVMVSFATTPTGVAFPKVNPSHLSVYLNSTDYINYTITVYNGTASPVTVGTSPAVAKYGVNVGFIPNSGLPPYSGKIRLYITPNATPGNYTLYLATSPNMSNTHGVAVIYLVVYNRTAPTTSTSTVATTSTVSPTSPTTVAPTAPTTVPPSTTVPPTTSITNPLLLEYVVIAVVVVVVVAILVYLLIRRNRF